MSGVFVEDPWSRIVDVHWKKKKPDEPPPDGGPPVEGPCGTLLLQGEGGYADYSQGQGIHMLDGTGVWYVAPELHPPQPDKPFSLINAVTVYNYLPANSYVWSQPANWTIAFGPAPPTASPEGHERYRLNVFRNLNIQVFAGLGVEEYLAVTPNQRADISLGGSLTVQPQQEREIYPPIYTVDLFDRVGQSWTRTGFPGGGIHAHCKQETAGGLPPQPPGFDMEEAKYPAPGSTNDPLKPPPLPPPSPPTIG
jgi:hypothetical protein